MISDNEHPIIKWYKEMLDKVVETLNNGNTVKFVNDKEQLGNNRLLFHFYKYKQVLNDLNGKINTKNFIIYDKSIVDARDLHNNYIKQDWCKEILKDWDDFGLPPAIVERYISSKMVDGDVISYLDNPYELSDKKESFENKALKWWMSLSTEEQVEIGFKYDEPTFNLTLRAIMFEFEQFKKK
jgi:hypothetical protein